MVELIRTNDPVLLSWLVSYLEDAGIPALVFDHNVSIVEGSIGAIPRRLIIADKDCEQAKRLLDEAGIEHVG